MIGSPTTAEGVGPRSERRPARAVALALVCTALVLYGGLFPLTGWRAPSINDRTLWHALRAERVSRADLLANVLVYLPVGFSWAFVLHRRAAVVAVGAATLLGAALSAGVEFAQIFVPGRVVSLVDFLANGAGSAIGAMSARVLVSEGGLGRRLRAWRQARVRPGRLGDVGLASLALWASSQLSPFVPSLDIGNLRHGLKPLWHALRDPALFAPGQAAGYALDIAGVGLLWFTIQRPGQYRWRPFAAFACAVLLLKVPVVSRQLSLEAVAGLSVALAALWALQGLDSYRAAGLGTTAIVAGFLVDGLRPFGVGPALASARSMNWIPLGGHLANPIVGMADLLIEAWPAAAAACLVLPVVAIRGRGVALGLGGMLWFALALGVELAQRWLPGRSPDLTDTLVPPAAWAVAWWFACGRSPAQAPGRDGDAVLDRVSSPTR